MSENPKLAGSVYNGINVAIQNLEAMKEGLDPSNAATVASLLERLREALPEADGLRKSLEGSPEKEVLAEYPVFI